MKEKIIIWIKGIWLKYKKPITYVGLIILVLSLVFLFGRLSTLKERKRLQSNYNASTEEIRTSKVIIGGLETSVYEKDAIIMSKNEAIKAGELEREKLRKLNLKEVITNTELSGIIHRQDSLLNLPPKTEFIIVIDSSGIKKNYVRYPFQLLKQHEQYLSLDAGLDSLKTAWFKLSIPFAGEVSVGYIKAGFLKTKPVGLFTTTNPYLTVDNMKVLIVEEKDHFWNKTWFHVVSGAGIFGLVNHFLLK